jgi:hypothetical protein
LNQLDARQSSRILSFAAHHANKALDFDGSFLHLTKVLTIPEHLVSGLDLRGRFVLVYVHLASVPPLYSDGRSSLHEEMVPITFHCFLCSEPLLNHDSRLLQNGKSYPKTATPVPRLDDNCCTFSLQEL